EIEDTLLTHPKVLEACTIGIPGGHRGATVKAYIVLKPGEKADAEEIIAHCRATLAPDKVPQSVRFIDTLPKSVVGKILRRAVSELDRNRPTKKSGNEKN
ncbi:MAG: long-chain fatty acid--CoA ligase, partial [Deltaproteobacteria bacterium]|nr:long-chain fatty acid--CoA ligase [Deltaproteobacteria bacterium]